MKKQLLTALLISIVTLVSCEDIKGSKSGAKETISVDQFDQKLSVTPGAQLIDVRTPDEYTGGHLKAAVNMDFNSDDFETQVGKLDKSKPVFVYCLSGGRSSRAANKLADMGFLNVYNMDGGIMKWRSAGKPLDKDSGAPKSTGISVTDFTKMTAGNKYVLVDYNARWCEPCKKMLPVLESIAEKKKEQLALLKIDADDNKELLNQKQISVIPFLELYKDGKLIWKHAGLIDESQFLSETGL